MKQNSPATIEVFDSTEEQLRNDLRRRGCTRFITLCMDGSRITELIDILQNSKWPGNFGYSQSAGCLVLGVRQ